MSRSKLTDQQRIAAVRAYLDGEGSYQSIAARFSINSRTLRDLVALALAQGEEALLAPTEAIIYPVELRQRAVEAYLAGEGSHQDICNRFGIRRRGQLREWIQQYLAYGSFSLMPAPRQRNIILHSVPGRRTTFDERVEIVGFCLANGCDYESAVARYHVSYDQLRRWVQHYRRDGVEGLCDNRGKPLPHPEMPLEQRLRAENYLLEAENQHLARENAALKKCSPRERR